MPYESHPDKNIDCGDRILRFRYEVWKDMNTREGIIAVEGRTDADHVFLTKNRVATAGLLRENEGLTAIRYLESQGNKLFTEMDLTMDATGRVVAARNTNIHLSATELYRQGERLLNREHQHTMDLARQEFQEQPGITRIKNDKGPDR